MLGVSAGERLKDRVFTVILNMVCNHTINIYRSELILLQTMAITLTKMYVVADANVSAR